MTRSDDKGVALWRCRRSRVWEGKRRGRCRSVNVQGAAAQQSPERAARCHRAISIPATQRQPTHERQPKSRRDDIPHEAGGMKPCRKQAGLSHCGSPAFLFMKDLFQICFQKSNPFLQHLHCLRQSIGVASTGHAEGLLSAATALDFFSHFADKLGGIQALGVGEGLGQQ